MSYPGLVGNTCPGEAGFYEDLARSRQLTYAMLEPLPTLSGSLTRWMGRKQEGVTQVRPGVDCALQDPCD